MRKYKSLWFYLLLALSLSLTIIVIDVLNSVIIPKIVQDINSGVIGAILTTIITLILLTNQTESQEKTTKNSVVYEEKLKVFNQFLAIIGKSLQDGQLSADEIQKIIFGFSTLRIHISAENSSKIEKSLALIDSEFFYVNENGVVDLDKYINFYTNLVNVFRNELYENNISNPLNNFNLSNLKSLTFKVRYYKLPLNNFDELIEKIQTFESIYYSAKNSPIIVFKIDDILIENFKVAFNKLNEVVLEYPKEINLEFNLTKFIVNEKEYAGLPWVKLTYANKHFAQFGISQKRRIHLTSRIPKNEQIFALETDDVEEFHLYENTIISLLNKVTLLIDENTDV